MADEVLRELWRVKDEIAKEFNYSVEALAAELQRLQKQPGRMVISRAQVKARRKPEPPRERSK